MRKNVFTIVLMALFSLPISVYAQDGNDTLDYGENFNDCNCEITRLSYKCGYCGNGLKTKFHDAGIKGKARALIDYACTNSECPQRHSHKGLMFSYLHPHICKEGRCCKITICSNHKTCKNECAVKNTFDVYIRENEKEELLGTLKPGEEKKYTSGIIKIYPHNEKFKSLQNY